MTLPPPPKPDQPRFVPIADHAVLVEFGETISDAAHAAVLALDQAIAAAPPVGLRETVPAYVNLLVDFDPCQTDHAEIIAALRRQIGPATARRQSRQQHKVAVCYDPPFAPDLAQVAQHTGLSPEAVIAAHLSGRYHVVMYGFAPGYAYLAGLPPALRLDRKPTPVPNVPAGSVIIAGAQALVTTLTMPTGWWIIGRSATPILTGDPDRPFLFDVGDSVGFCRIGAGDMPGAAQNG
ncbi:5-oxoprolinase subunit B family protein [Pseudotabrizicola sp. L79]|uniref:5-oxoprolinase subunit B family protein n=1 Tax=Pseudotabrizicola sp. L79 TaxID=3118402 RepID=UPI002F95F109